MLQVGSHRLTKEDEARIKNASLLAQRLEIFWINYFASVIRKSSTLDADRITAGATLVPPNFERMLTQHFFDVQIKSYKQVERESLTPKKRLSWKVPKNIRDIMSLYDRWRKGLWKPSKLIQKEAAKLKEIYIEAIQKTWHKYSDDFRNGGEQTQKEIVKEIQRSTGAATTRSGVIVRTETTRYYNTARINYYGASPDITHYLFMAVRDAATTPWCTQKTTEGKRGRHGLVYAKEDELFKKERPPTHYNCRSEVLPLTPLNPAHRKMIEDKSIQRRNHQCYPLLPGWSSR